MRRAASALPLFALVAAAASGQELRSLRAIPTPRPGETRGAFLPVDRTIVEQAVHELFRAWNTPRLRQLLSRDFYEATRLVDVLATEVPRDSVLRVLAFESMTTLEQVREPGKGGRAETLVSKVAVLVRSQLEFNDPVEGFVRREGLNEMIFEVRTGGGAQ